MPSEHLAFPAWSLRGFQGSPRPKYYSNHLDSVINELKLLKSYQIDTKFAKKNRPRNIKNMPSDHFGLRTGFLSEGFQGSPRENTTPITKLVSEMSLSN